MELSSLATDGVIWIEKYSKRYGRTYYKNKESGITSWKKPDVFPATGFEHDETVTWVVKFSESKQRKYWKSSDGTTTWRNPILHSKRNPHRDINFSGSWKMRWSERYRRAYWKHSETGVISWKKPCNDVTARDDTLYLCAYCWMEIEAGETDEDLEKISTGPDSVDRYSVMLELSLYQTDCTIKISSKDVSASIVESKSTIDHICTVNVRSFKKIVYTAFLGEITIALPEDALAPIDNINDSPSNMDSFLLRLFFPRPNMCRDIFNFMLPALRRSQIIYATDPSSDKKRSNGAGVATTVENNPAPRSSCLKTLHVSMIGGDSPEPAILIPRPLPQASSPLSESLCKVGLDTEISSTSRRAVEVELPVKDEGWEEVVGVIETKDHREEIELLFKSSSEIIVAKKAAAAQFDREERSIEKDDDVFETVTDLERTLAALAAPSEGDIHEAFPSEKDVRSVNKKIFELSERNHRLLASLMSYENEYISSSKLDVPVLTISPADLHLCSKVVFFLRANPHLLVFKLRGRDSTWARVAVKRLFVNWSCDYQSLSDFITLAIHADDENRKQEQYDDAHELGPIRHVLWQLRDNIDVISFATRITADLGAANGFAARLKKVIEIQEEVEDPTELRLKTTSLIGKVCRLVIEPFFVCLCDSLINTAPPLIICLLRGLSQRPESMDSTFTPIYNLIVPHVMNWIFQLLIDGKDPRSAKSKSDDVLESLITLTYDILYLAFHKDFNNFPPDSKDYYDAPVETLNLMSLYDRSLIHNCRQHLDRTITHLIEGRIGVPMSSAPLDPFAPRSSSQASSSPVAALSGVADDDWVKPVSALSHLVLKPSELLALVTLLDDLLTGSRSPATPSSKNLLVLLPHEIIDALRHLRTSAGIRLLKTRPAADWDRRNSILLSRFQTNPWGSVDSDDIEAVTFGSGTIHATHLLGLNDTIRAATRYLKHLHASEIQEQDDDVSMRKLREIRTLISSVASKSESIRQCCIDFKRLQLCLQYLEFQNSALEALLEQRKAAKPGDKAVSQDGDNLLHCSIPQSLFVTLVSAEKNLIALSHAVVQTSPDAAQRRASPQTSRSEEAYSPTDLLTASPPGVDRSSFFPFNTLTAPERTPITTRYTNTTSRISSSGGSSAEMIMRILQGRDAAQSASDSATQPKGHRQMRTNVNHGRPSSSPSTLSFTSNPLRKSISQIASSM